jgi:hypothetical protein
MATVAFNGSNKTITITLPTTTTTVDAVEVYSKWKEWVATGNEQWLPAFSNSVGNDPLGGGSYLGQYLFLNNHLGWRIGTTGTAGQKVLYLTGNLYGVDPDSPIIDNSAYASDVTVIFERSSLASGVATGGSSGPTPDEVAQAVWSQDMADYNTPSTFGRRLKELFPSFWGIK